MTEDEDGPEMTIEEANRMCDRIAAEMALAFVGEDEDRISDALRVMRKRLEVGLADLLTPEGIARFFEVFTAEVWRRRAAIEDAAGGPSALRRPSR